MKRMFPAVVVSLLLSASLASAFTWDDLSPAAKRIVSKERIVVLKLANGQTQEGVIVSESEDSITLRQKRGAMEYELPYLRSSIQRMEEQSVCAAFLTALRPLAYEPKRPYTEEQCGQALALLDEYLTKCPGDDNADAVRVHRDAYAQEIENMRQGLEKVGEEWLPAVAAAVRKFDLLEERIDELLKQYRGVDQPNFRGDPRAVQHYNQIIETRRSIARDLPEIVTRRVPQLIEANRFHDAAAELTSFIRFWVNRVIRTEAGGARTRKDQMQEIFQAMDFGLLIRLQQQVMAAYEQASVKDPRAGEVGEDGMVYIPGGFFLLGDPAAELRSDLFPMRIIYLEPYWLDQFEVSNRQYREFVEYVERTGDYSMAHPDAPLLKKHRPKGWDFPGLAEDNQPVVGIDWFDAYAYAKWRGKRLPTEAEWERAARGPNNTLYPWGSDPIGGQVINWVEGRQRISAEMNRLNPPPPPPKRGLFGGEPPPPPPPFRLPDVTWNVDALRPPQVTHPFFDDIKHTVGPWGLYHMAGNAAEWVYDWYDPQGYGGLELINPAGASDGKGRVFRGGSFQSADSAELSAQFRHSPAKPVRVSRHQT